MSDRKYVSLDYSALIPADFMEDQKLDSGEMLSISHDWGTVSGKAVFLPHLALLDISATLRQNVHIRQHENYECTTVNSCFTLSGQIDSNFSGFKEKMCMRNGKHNFIYKPVLEDDHFVSSGNEPLRLLHISIDRMYYMGLLAGKEKWCDALIEKINRKECITGSTDDMDINPSIHRVLVDIMNCPLTGPLRNLVMEAKVLELIAYQLHHFNQQTNNLECESYAAQRNERDTFFALKEYLNSSFEKDHSLRSLSKEFGLNEFKLKKGFKDLFGFTVFGYIHFLKMQHAKTLIEDHGLNITQVAGKIGYKNPNHFSSAFKKQFGLSPSSIRR